MTTAQWRTDPKTVANLRLALSDPTLQEALALLKETGPVSTSSPTDITATYALVRLGRCEGYAEFHAALNRLATYVDKVEDIPADYGADIED